MRNSSGVTYIHSDQLGSATNTTGATTATQRYYPWGTIRPGPANGLPTDYTYTGQKLDASTGLMYYVARYYDPALGRFVQPDTIVPEPGNPQALNRYSYVLNDPVKYTDPSGHAYDVFGGEWQPYWWEDPHLGAPSIYDVIPGGDYGYGQIPLAGRMVSVYVPPMIDSYFTGEGCFPLAGASNDGVRLVAAHSEFNYLYGEEVSGRNLVKPNTWQDVAVLQRTELPNPGDALVGLANGLNSLPDSLPLEPHATGAEVQTNAFIAGAYALNGVLAAGWNTLFRLQQRIGENDYRMIILTRHVTSSVRYSRAFERLLPYAPDPHPAYARRWR